MKTNKQHNEDNNTQLVKLEISDKQTEILARRLLPEIKKFFADPDIHKEFEKWKEQKLI